MPHRGRLYLDRYPMPRTLGGPPKIWTAFVTKPGEIDALWKNSLRRNNGRLYRPVLSNEAISACAAPAASSASLPAPAGLHLPANVGADLQESIMPTRRRTAVADYVAFDERPETETGIQVGAPRRLRLQILPVERKLPGRDYAALDRGQRAGAVTSNCCARVPHRGKSGHWTLQHFVMIGHIDLRPKRPIVDISKGNHARRWRDR